MNKISKKAYNVMYAVAFAALIAAYLLNPEAFSVLKSLCYAYGFMLYIMFYAGALENNEPQLFGVANAGYIFVVAILLILGTPFWMLPLLSASILLVISVIAAYITSEPLDEKWLLINVGVITIMIYAAWYIFHVVYNFFS